MHFTDPFIADVVGAWLKRERYADSMISESAKVESVVASHYKRRGPTYYMKGEGEIDIVAVKGRGFVPVEVKWTGQIHGRDLNQIRKYSNAVIVTRQPVIGTVDGIAAIPLPLHLLSL